MTKEENLVHDHVYHHVTINSSVWLIKNGLKTGELSHDEMIKELDTIKIQNDLLTKIVDKLYDLCKEYKNDKRTKTN